MTRFGYWSLVALGTGLFVALAAAPAQAQTALRYTFKKGEKLNYVTEMKSTTDTTIAGKDFSMTSAYTYDFTWKITEVGADGRAKMVQILNRVRFEQDGLQGKSEFDSEKGEEPTDAVGKALVPLYKAMVGAEFKVTMNPQGETSDWEIPEKVADAIKNAPGGKIIERTIKDFTSAEGQLLPKDAVKLGGTWNTKSALSMEPVGTMVKNTRYTYEGQGTGDHKGLEYISFQPTLRADVAAESTEQVKFTMQENKGTTYFDNKKGRLVESSLVLKMELKITAGGTSVPMKLTQSQRTKLIPAK